MPRKPMLTRPPVLDGVGETHALPGAVSGRDFVQPLGKEERKEAEQRGRRLSAELAAALAVLPGECGTIRGMAAYLNVNANICQRAVAASQLADQPLEAIVRAPGVSGLRSLVTAFEARQVKKSLVSAIDAAVEQFGEFIRACGGGSLAYLRRRIAATGEAELHQQVDADERAEEQTRRRMFQSTAAWFGARVRTHAVISVTRVHPDKPDYIQGRMVNAYIGHRARASAPPLLLGSLSSVDESSSDNPTPARQLSVAQVEETEGVLLRKFSSSPPPIVSTRSKDLLSLQIIDNAAASAGPVDSVIYTAFPDVLHPSRYPTPIFSTYVLVSQPTQELVFDVWMERPLAAASIPSGKIGFAGKPLREGDGLPWYHRLPGTVNLELLSPESIKPVESWPSHVAATKHLFERLQWPLGSFVGYRMRITYPVWNTAGVMHFDFPRPGDSPAN